MDFIAEHLPQVAGAAAALVVAAAMFAIAWSWGGDGLGIEDENMGDDKWASKAG